MNKTFVHYLMFLRKHNALENYINAIEKTGAVDRLAGLVAGKIFTSEKVQAMMFPNVFIWMLADEGQKYWEELEHAWFKEIGIGVGEEPEW